MDNNDPTVHFQSVYDDKTGNGGKSVDLAQAETMVTNYGVAITNDTNAVNEHHNAGTEAELNDAITDEARANAAVSTLQAEIQANAANVAAAAQYSSGVLPTSTPATTASAGPSNTPDVSSNLTPSLTGGGSESSQPIGNGGNGNDTAYAGGSGSTATTASAGPSNTPDVSSNLTPSLTGGGSESSQPIGNGGNGNDTAYAGGSGQTPEASTSGTASTGATGVLATSLHTVTGSVVSGAVRNAAATVGAAAADITNTATTQTTDSQGGIGHQNLGDNGSSYTSYVIQPGDNLTDIAKNKGVSLSALEQANSELPDFNKIYPGHTINIPTETSGGGNTSASNTSGGNAGGAMTQSSSPEEVIMKGLNGDNNQGFVTKMFKRK